MSDLQISLLVIGAVIVVLVLVFNWFQERRFRNQADAALQAPVADVLMQREAASAARDLHNRVEPAFDAAAVNEPAQAHAPDMRIDVEPAQAGASPAVAYDQAARTVRPAVAVSGQPASPPVAAPAAPYDELIEYRIRLGSDGVQANALADTFTTTRTLGKAVRWMGLPVGAAQWEEVQPWRDVHYQQLVITMQLADRNGAVLEEQLTSLCELMQAMAQVHGLRVACDDVVEALERAQAIDRFCVDVDVLIGLNVVARGEGTVNLTRIVHEAESGGMVLGMDGVFQLLDSRSEQLYALCNHDAEPFTNEVVEGQTSQGVTLQFDVPRVPDGLKVFDGMVAFGRKLANEVGGILVDDNLRPLTDTGIEKIRTQLMQIYERMEARGVPSGSRRALRLFS
ncbi:MAG: cell division protein ZipA C-terminal FtsZ-binding domain-containing protein [Gammaproteobacteria bacterium]|nr:cell division protein ZipA C-terminal FtsZ-binding domain-containing protein [Gammaproteobacteria bacterium]